MVTYMQHNLEAFMGLSFNTLEDNSQRACAVLGAKPIFHSPGTKNRSSYSNLEYFMGLSCNTQEDTSQRAGAVQSQRPNLSLLHIFEGEGICRNLCMTASQKNQEWASQRACPRAKPILSLFRTTSRIFGRPVHQILRLSQSHNLSIQNLILVPYECVLPSN